MADWWASVIDLWHAGGFVMPWLVGSTAVLWWAIGERTLSLRRGDRRPLERVVEAHLAGQVRARGVLGTAIQRVLALPVHQRTSGRIHETLQPMFAELERHRVLITSVAGTAPLVGLLGTVTGMIETFDSLTTMSMHSSTGGIAGGISAALISTQMGLAVAIPGMLAGRLLERRQHRLEDELDTLSELLLRRQRQEAA